MSENVKKVISQEIKDKMKSFGGFSLSETIDLVPTNYKELPKEYWPIFSFNSLDSITSLKFQNIVSGFDSEDQDKLVDTFEKTIDFLSNKFLSVSNMRDQDNLDNVLNLDGDNVIKNLSISLIADLAVQLLTKNKLTEEEREGLI